MQANDHEHHDQPGATAPDLLAHALDVVRQGRPELLTAKSLARWLIDGGFAVEHDGRLHPTERAREIADALDEP